MSEGIKGSGAVFTTQAGVEPADDHSDDLKAIRITSEDRDDADLTFAEAASGDLKDFQLVVTAIQSTEVGSLWRELWDGPGEERDVVYGPHGNAVPTATKPHFLMTVKATGKPEVGGEAARKGNRFDFEYTYDVTSGPTLDDGS
jgi:hypothetical protein